MQPPQPLRHLSPRTRVVVDNRGVMLGDPNNNILGHTPTSGVLGGFRVLYALTTNVSGGELSGRYRPPHPPFEVCTFMMDFSNVIPLGVGIASGTLDIHQNTVPPSEASSDWTIGPVKVRGRALYATLGGGVHGSDYRLSWYATDTEGNVWPRTGLVLVAATT